MGGMSKHLAKGLLAAALLGGALTPANGQLIFRQLRSIPSFNPLDGNNTPYSPAANLIEGRDHALYGTSSAGGVSTNGGVFRLNKDDALLCRKIAKGRFTLDLRSGRTNHLLVSTVTGIAPYVSYVRTLYRDWKKGDSSMPGNHKLYCLQGASRSWEFGYREELERYSNDAPWFKYVATVSRPWEDLDWKGETGRVDDLLRKYADRWGLRSEETTGYLCGHPTMVENCRGILQRAGWKKDAVFEEVYFQEARGERAGAG